MTPVLLDRMGARDAGVSKAQITPPIFQRVAKAASLYRDSEVKGRLG